MAIDNIARSAANNVGAESISTPNSPTNGDILVYTNGVLEWQAPSTGSNYLGIWDASANTPTITSGLGTLGDFYVVSAAGSTPIDGISTWEVNDRIQFNGTVWQRIPAIQVYNDPVEISETQAISQINTVYLVNATIADAVITIPDANSNNGGQSVQILKNSGTFNIIVKTTTNQNIGSSATQTILNVDEGLTIVSRGVDTSWVITQDSRSEPVNSIDVVYDNSGSTLASTDVESALDELDSKYNYEFIHTSVDVSPAVPYKTYLVDSSASVVTISLPNVTASDTRWYRVVLNANGRHARVTTVGGTQTFMVNEQVVTSVEIPTVQTGLLLKSNGVDGYEVIEDTRPYYRNISVIGDLDLTQGYESAGIYVGNLSDSQVALVTLPEANLAHLGFMAKFVKHSGLNATYRIKTSDGSFDQTIFENETGFAVTIIEDSLGLPQYEITQDNRPSSSNITINFLPTATLSTIEPTYGVLETANQPEAVLSSIAITSADPLNPNSLGFWINDNKALIGTLAETNISAFAQVKLQSSYNRAPRIKFRYYEYDFSTNTLNPVFLSETSYSTDIDGIAYEQVFVGGVLPSNTWATEDESSNNTLVIELLAYKTVGGGDNPIIDFRTGGTAPSKTTIDVPVASVNHNTLGGVVPASTGIPDGHVNNSVPLQLPELTTIERDSFVPNAGMMIFNTTLGKTQFYEAGVWNNLIP